MWRRYNFKIQPFTLARLPTDAGVFFKSFLSLFYTLDKKHDLNMPQVHTFMQLFALELLGAFVFSHFPNKSRSVKYLPNLSFSTLIHEVTFWLSFRTFGLPAAKKTRPFNHLL